MCRRMPVQSADSGRHVSSCSGAAERAETKGASGALEATSFTLPHPSTGSSSVQCHFHHARRDVPITEAFQQWERCSALAAANTKKCSRQRTAAGYLPLQSLFSYEELVLPACQCTWAPGFNRRPCSVLHSKPMLAGLWMAANA